MDIFSVIGLAVTCAAICILLAEYKPEYAMMVSLCACLLIFAAVFSNAAPVFGKLKEFAGKISYENEYISVVIKALGICYITQLASDACADAGQKAIASKVELAGKTAVVLISLPLFSNLMEIVIDIIKL